MKPTFYKILKVPTTADKKLIKSQFYALSKQFHPDLNKGNSEQFIQISDAYSTLMDDRKRKEYDTTLSYSTTTASTSTYQPFHRPQTYNQRTHINPDDYIQFKKRSEQFKKYDYSRHQYEHYNIHWRFHTHGNENKQDKAARDQLRQANILKVVFVCVVLVCLPELIWLN